MSGISDLRRQLADDGSQQQQNSLSSFLNSSSADPRKDAIRLNLESRINAASSSSVPSSSGPVSSNNLPLSIDLEKKEEIRRRLLASSSFGPSFASSSSSFLSSSSASAGLSASQQPAFSSSASSAPSDADPVSREKLELIKAMLADRRALAVMTQQQQQQQQFQQSQSNQQYQSQAAVALSSFDAQKIRSFIDERKALSSVPSSSSVPAGVEPSVDSSFMSEEEAHPSQDQQLMFEDLTASESNMNSQMRFQGALHRLGQQQQPSPDRQQYQHQQQQQQHQQQTSPSQQHGDDVYTRLFNLSLSMKAKQAQKQAESSYAEENLKRTPEITRQAASLRRPENIAVEDVLIRKADEYSAHIDELRKQREAEELQQMQGSPRINKKSSQMVRNESTFDRLYQSRKLSQAKRELLKNELIEKELSEVRSQPNINPVSQNMERGVNSFFAWEEQKKKKLAALKAQREEEERALYVGAPAIDKLSEVIAKKTGHTSVPVQDRLLVQAELSRKKKELARQQAIEESKATSVPTVSVHSARLQRQGDVSERLYQFAMQLEDKKRELKEKQEQDIIRKRDPSTGQRLHQPFINPRSSALVRNQPVEEHLLQKGAEMEEKKKYMAAKIISEDRPASSPHIGPYSQLLAGLMEKRTNMSTADRLSQPIHTFKSKTIEDIEQSDSQCTFKPSINPTSRLIDECVNGSVGGPLQRQNLLLQKAKDYQEHKMVLLQQQLLKEQVECSFVPNENVSPNRSSSSPLRSNNNRSLEMSMNASSMSGDLSRSRVVSESQVNDFVRRNEEWAKQREKILEDERKKREEDSIKACTFRPEIEVRSTSPNRASSLHRIETASSLGKRNSLRPSGGSSALSSSGSGFGFDYPMVSSPRSSVVSSSSPQPRSFTPPPRSASSSASQQASAAQLPMKKRSQTPPPTRTSSGSLSARSSRPAASSAAPSSASANIGAPVPVSASASNASSASSSQTAAQREFSQKRAAAAAIAAQMQQQAVLRSQQQQQQQYSRLSGGADDFSESSIARAMSAGIQAASRQPGLPANRDNEERIDQATEEWLRRHVLALGDL